MTADEARELGYGLIKASPIEVGLVYKGKGLKTWWASHFGGILPPLDHPDVMEAIGIWEENTSIKIGEQRK